MNKNYYFLFKNAMNWNILVVADKINIVSTGEGKR